MKILQVITSLATGGAEMLVTELSVLLRQRGHDVDVALFKGGPSPMKDKLIDAGCKVFEFGNSYYNPLYVLKLQRLMRKYDIVHTHNSSPQMYAAMAAVLCSVELCSTEHNTSNRKRGWKWYAPVDHWMYNRYRTLICISNQAETNLKAYLKTCRAHIVTIPNGVNIERFRTAQPIADLKTHPGRFVTVMVAGFRYQKDQETLIRAIARLPEAQHELWLVGDGERRPILEALIKELGVEDRVRLLGIRRDIPEILHTADAVCMSSHFEGLSLSSIEGMCVGKPFIASDVDGLHEITEGAGLLFPHGDDEALAAILDKLAADADYRKAVADSCYSRACQYDIQKTVEGYEGVYADLMRR